MQQLHQHPNGMIYVRTDAGTYGDTATNFRKDYGKAPPKLPGEITERIYEPNRRHALKVGSNVVSGGPTSWKVGDDIIAALDDLVAAKMARLAKE